MEIYQVIFNDVPLKKRNLIWETVYLPKVVVFEVNEYKDLFEKIDNYILESKIEYSSYEINIVK